MKLINKFEPLYFQGKHIQKIEAYYHSCYECALYDFCRSGNTFHIHIKFKYLENCGVHYIFKEI